MNVVDYELFTVPPRWLFLKVTTDEGVIGWGEPVVEGRATTVRTAVDELMNDYVLGADPLEIERLWQMMYRGNHYRGGPILMSAIAGIDQALWDIRGKVVKQPVYELLGGPVRDRVRVCQWISGERPDEVAEAARDAVDRGYTAVEMMMNARPSRLETSDFVRMADQRLEEVRETVGESVDIAVDFRGRVSRSVAKQLLSVLDRYELMFVEEPVLPEHNDVLSEITNSTQTPIATGQRMYSRWDFKKLLQNGTIDIFQPAISHAGGITEVYKIANMCEPFDISVIPKCSVGPIAYTACVHVNLALQNAVLQEQHDEIYSRGEPSYFSYLTNNEFFTHENGYLSIPASPGLGIEIDEEYVREQAAEEVQWRSPLWQHEDGSIANW